ncbi:tetratricopeptide repeat protein [Polymorphospora sp. NPDC051019]|uniref:ATP-binding protein n=1 Tax=Polymorphospora sp. NPDC051019 TaxID=3155725 RepID=UPI00341C29A1
MAVSPGGDGRPDPAAASTAAEFVEALRRLKNWSGVGFRRLESRAAAAGRMLPRSTVTAALARDTLPREDLVVALVRTCGGDDEEVHRWVTARRRLAALRPAPVAEPAPGPAPARCTLPADQAVFVGRDKEIEQIVSTVADAARAGEVVSIHAIDGMAGVGKTTLAVHVAHRLKDRFGDRQLFLSLHAYTSGRHPADPADLLADLLAADGVDARFLPPTLDGRAALWRDRMNGRRLLLVLDDAASTNQVLPLLPGTPGCLVLVTSRRILADLPAPVPIGLDVLSPDEAATMFARLAARDAGREVAELVHACGHLPLAISIMASLYRRHRSWTIAELRREMRQPAGGLLTLTAEHRTVAAVFDLSYQHLPAGRQRLFRLLGLHPGVEFDGYAVAALAGLPVHEAGLHLDELQRDHLLEESAYRRYRMHDLVRSHAVHLTTAADPPETRAAATGRLLAYYRDAAALAVSVTDPHERRRRKTTPADSPLPDLPDAGHAGRWLKNELANLLTAAAHSGPDRPEPAWEMSVLLHRHLRTHGQYQEAESLHQHSLDLARLAGNQEAETDALIDLGYVHRAQGRHELAEEHYGLALRIARRRGDRSGELYAQHGLGHVNWMRGNNERSATHYGRSLAVAAEIGDRGGELAALNGLGHVGMLLGQYEQAENHYRRALRIAGDLGDRSGELQALTGLGVIRLKLGELEQALRHYGEALRIAQDSGNRAGELYALHGLGHVRWLLGQHEPAAGHQTRALRIAQDIGDRTGELQALVGLGHAHLAQCRFAPADECYEQALRKGRELGSANWQFEALQGLGRLRQAMGQPAVALVQHRQALRHATGLGQLPDQARAHDGLAHAYLAIGDRELAGKHWQVALDLLAKLGTDHTDDAQTTGPRIRAQLGELRGGR